LSLSLLNYKFEETPRIWFRRFRGW
jgi:hypothetical protein